MCQRRGEKDLDVRTMAIFPDPCCYVDSCRVMGNLQTQQQRSGVVLSLLSTASHPRSSSGRCAIRLSDRKAAVKPNSRKSLRQTARMCCHRIIRPVQHTCGLSPKQRRLVCTLNPPPPCPKARLHLKLILLLCNFCCYFTATTVCSLFLPTLHPRESPALYYIKRQQCNLRVRPVPCGDDHRRCLQQQQQR